LVNDFVVSHLQQACAAKYNLSLIAVGNQNVDNSGQRFISQANSEPPFMVMCTKCATGSKAMYGSGVKVGILYGAEPMFLLVVVIGGIIFVIQQVKQSQKLAYLI
jgi:hypothetical protein